MEWDEVRLLASGFRSRCLSAGPVKALRHSPTQTRTIAHVLLCPRLRIRQLTRDERQKASQENKSLKCGLPQNEEVDFCMLFAPSLDFLGLRRGAQLGDWQREPWGKGKGKDECEYAKLFLCACVCVCVRPFDRTQAYPSGIFINDPF